MFSAVPPMSWLDRSGESMSVSRSNVFMLGGAYLRSAVIAAHCRLAGRSVGATPAGTWV